MTKGPMRLLVTGGSGFIGTNLVSHFIEEGVPVRNIDWNPPLDPAQRDHWWDLDIMDQAGLRRVFQDFQPTHVVHLAARTDTIEKHDVEAYLQNHEGTRRLLEVINDFPSVERVVVTSTQFVCEAGYHPRHDQDFKPFTIYGESKRRTEEVTRNARLKAVWTIIRPTTIWGPWSLRYRDVMFKIMRKGLYFHPGRQRVIRSYGYVGNVVWQIGRILHADRSAMDGRVFYVGDRPFDLKVWVEAVSRELTGRRVRYIPSWLVRALALGGDLVTAVGLPFPITSGRYHSMTSDYETPMDRTIEALGEAPWSMEEGIRETVRWYDQQSARVQAPQERRAEKAAKGP